MKIELLADYPEFTEQVARWNFKAWPEHYSKSGFRFAMREAQQALSRASLPLSLVALENGRAAGTISVVSHDLPNRKDLSPWITSLYVAPEFRHKGFAKRLVDTALSHVRKLGFHNAYLWVEKNSDVYVHWGWKFVDETYFQNRHIHILKGDVDYLLQKT